MIHNSNLLGESLGLIIAKTSLLSNILLCVSELSWGFWSRVNVSVTLYATNWLRLESTTIESCPIRDLLIIAQKFS